MAELTASEQQMVRDAVAEVLLEDDEMALKAPAAPRRDVTDIKELFCENWPTVKAVLEFLSNYLPAWLKPIVNTIIKIGDRVHAAICG